MRNRNEDWLKNEELCYRSKTESTAALSRERVFWTDQKYRRIHTARAPRFEETGAKNMSTLQHQKRWGPSGFPAHIAAAVARCCTTDEEFLAGIERLQLTRARISIGCWNTVKRNGPLIRLELLSWSCPLKCSKYQLLALLLLLLLLLLILLLRTRYHLGSSLLDRRSGPRHSSHVSSGGSLLTPLAPSHADHPPRRLSTPWSPEERWEHLVSHCRAAVRRWLASRRASQREP
jgi:hypothetical protein